MTILSEPGESLLNSGPRDLPGFEVITLSQLDEADPDWLDTLPYGVVGLGPTGNVEIYNKAEASLAGLIAPNVIGRPFFLSVAPCMNNFMVAQRFVDEPEIDVVVNYVLTFRMRPTSVRLRLLNKPTSRLSFILVQR